MDISLPNEFINQLKELDFFDLDSYLESFNQEITSVRINPKKIKFDDIPYESIPWSDKGYYLESRPEFILDPQWHAGAYYVQEAGSMFIEEVLKQIGILEEDIFALDLAAAPGGKSTHLLSLISENSLLISNEILPKRSKILEENIIRWGYDNVIVTNNSSNDFRKFNSQFDLIVLDAPCSGEGMFRKDRNSINEWSLNNVNMCVERQKDILENIKELLKFNGYLFYSTCTFNKEENENLIEIFANDNNFELVDIDISNFQSLIKNNKTIRAIPGKTMSEGFTITVLRNKNQNENSFKSKNKISLKSTQNPFSNIFSYNSEYNIFEFREDLFLFKNKFKPILEQCLNELKVITFGNKIANSKKSKRNQIFIPEHNLSSAVNIERNNVVELDDKNALKFLKGESLTLEIDENNAYFVSHKNYLIGLVKVANGRANNLYPDNFRIKKTVDYNEPIKSLF